MCDKASSSSELVRLLRPRVYQFKTTMEGVSPPIWRRIQVLSTIGFFALHLAIQDVLGWTSRYAYRFQEFSARPDAISVRRPSNRGAPSYRNDPLINCYFTKAGDTAMYVYHYGSLWKFQVMLERITPSVHGVFYPLCVAGRRGCPPEDFDGGAEAFKNVLKSSADPNNPSLKATGYSDEFYPRSVVFQDEVELFTADFEM